MQIPSAPLATIVINEHHDIEYGQIIRPSNNLMELQRYTCKILFNGLIYVFFLCALAFIIYEYHPIIAHYLTKIHYI